jgi:prepilin-type N-terminal cleavage/methylation domain-containing protein
MRHSARRSAAGAGPGRGRGFTLIELLTVVAIISLLVSMVVPTITAILESLTDAKTLARIRALSAGAQMYKIGATGNRYFPGQQYPEKIETTGSEAYRAASSYLARCLFSKPDPNNVGKDLFPVDNYAGYDEGLLDDAEGTDSNVPYTILDAHSRTMAIVYYVGGKDMEGTLAQFKPEHNLKYTENNEAEGSTGEGQVTGKLTIREYVKGAQDEAGQQIIYRDGSFVLHAADGKTRLYFAGTLRNWE